MDYLCVCLSMPYGLVFITVMFVVGFLAVPGQLGSFQGSIELWRHAMGDGYVITLFRDEIIQVHQAFELIFKGCV